MIACGRCYQSKLCFVSYCITHTSRVSVSRRAVCRVPSRAAPSRSVRPPSPWRTSAVPLPFASRPAPSRLVAPASPRVVASSWRLTSSVAFCPCRPVPRNPSQTLQLASHVPPLGWRPTPSLPRWCTGYLFYCFVAEPKLSQIFSLFIANGAFFTYATSFAIVHARCDDTAFSLIKIRLIFSHGFGHTIASFLTIRTAPAKNCHNQNERKKTHTPLHQGLPPATPASVAMSFCRSLAFTLIRASTWT